MRKLFKGVRNFFGNTSTPRYLPPIPTTDDELMTARLRSEAARELLSNPVIQEAFQSVNEQIVAEIALSGAEDDRLRIELITKLQVVTDVQQALMTFVNDYETMIIMREAERRSEEEAA